MQRPETSRAAWLLVFGTVLGACLQSSPPAAQDPAELERICARRAPPAEGSLVIPPLSPALPTQDGFVPVTARTGQGLLVIDPQNYRYQVHLPSACLADGENPSTIVRICVSDAGAVARVDVLRPSVLPYLDSEVPLVIQSWRYAPYQVEGVPTAFCYVLSYRVR